FVGSKDIIWTYKRSPRNVRAMVYSYVLTMFILNIMITVGLTIFFTFFLEFDFFTLIFFFTFSLIYNQLVLFQAIGIQCLSPSFEEKGSAMTSNNLMLMVLQWVPFQFVFFILIVIFEPPTSPELAKFYFLSPMLLLTAVIAIPLLFLGIRHLGKIE
ncbi:unnamed protein product, partial [marine sediment metagenome]